MIHARQVLYHWATFPTIYNLSPFALSMLQASGEHTGPSTLPFETGSPTGLDLCGQVRNTPVTSFLRLGFEAHSTVPRFLYKFLDSNLGPGVVKAITLPTEPSRHPVFVWLLMSCFVLEVELGLLPMSSLMILPVLVSFPLPPCFSSVPRHPPPQHILLSSALHQHLALMQAWNVCDGKPLSLCP